MTLIPADPISTEEMCATAATMSRTISGRFEFERTGEAARPGAQRLPQSCRSGDVQVQVAGATAGQCAWRKATKQNPEKEEVVHQGDMKKQPGELG